MPLSYFKITKYDSIYQKTKHDLWNDCLKLIDSIAIKEISPEINQNDTLFLHILHRIMPISN